MVPWESQSAAPVCPVASTQGPQGHFFPFSAHNLFFFFLNWVRESVMWLFFFKQEPLFNWVLKNSTCLLDLYWMIQNKELNNLKLFLEFVRQSIALYISRNAKPTGTGLKRNFLLTHIYSFIWSMVFEHLVCFWLLGFSEVKVRLLKI